VALVRLIVTERGIPLRGRPPRERSACSSRGSHTPPGRLGKPTTGRRGTGGETLSCHAVREMRSAKVVLNVTCHLKVARSATGEPDAWKLARPVRRGEVGKGPSRATRRPPTQPFIIWLKKKTLPTEDLIFRVMTKEWSRPPARYHSWSFSVGPSPNGTCEFPGIPLSSFRFSPLGLSASRVAVSGLSGSPVALRPVETLSSAPRQVVTPATTTATPFP
jgi:hypothetical protein